MIKIKLKSIFIILLLIVGVTVVAGASFSSVEQETDGSLFINNFFNSGNSAKLFDSSDPGTPMPDGNNTGSGG